MDKSLVDGEQIGLGDSKVPVEDFDELALDPANVALAERAGDHRPVDVFQCRVVRVLGGDDQSAEEDAVEGPVLALDGQVRLGALDVDEGDEDIGEGNLGSLDDTRDELGKLGLFVVAGQRTAARRGGGEIKGKVDDFDGGLNELFCESMVS